jgi:hypothetical protein
MIFFICCCENDTVFNPNPSLTLLSLLWVFGRIRFVVFGVLFLLCPKNFFRVKRMMTDNVYVEMGLNEKEINGFKNFHEPQTFLNEERDARRRSKAVNSLIF